MTTLPSTAPEVSPRPLSPLGRLRQRITALSSTRYALAAMLFISVVDGSVFPVPPFALLVPMVLAQPKRWWSLAALGTVFSIAGGFIGYGLGHAFQDAAAAWFHIDLNVQITRFGINRSLGELLSDNFWFLALLCSVLPTPFKVVAIGSGIVGVDLFSFFLAACIGRTARFFGVAGAMRFAGPVARKWLRLEPVRR